MSEIRFRTGALRDGGRSLQRAGEDLGAQLDSLLASEPAWGEDDVSALCQVVYQSVVEVVRESVTASAEAFADHAAKLQTAAALYDSVEETNASAADSIGAELGREA
ncbi:hypothetical protein GC722_12105 [Auraticoccus sp. F435]|uniref:PE domain-containing protein n=1 Tax=Auraticoccus cholistanensis TaxID=2656650 RepID=A0A6A9V1A4_9ACTN|nr:hypothetical protein [Auraticoccus cholistanensis]MVA76760.1 hypothetical protein [Auraticoccus cholistanensis]